MVKAAADYPGGFLLGPAPGTHGRHHRACTWVLLDLYRSLRTHLPHNLQCLDFLSFRCLFGIRAGTFKPKDSHKAAIQVYFVHTADPLYWAGLREAFERYSKASGALPLVFNLKTAPISFPSGRARKAEEQALSRRLNTASRAIGALRRINLPYIVPPTFSVAHAARIIAIQDLKTYCFSLLQESNSFTIRLFFISTPTSTHYRVSTFDSLFAGLDPERATSPAPHAPLTLPPAAPASPPPASLLDLYDAPESPAACTTSTSSRSRGKVKKVYAVARGRTIGIFHSWADCSASVMGFPNNNYQSFASEDEARAFLSLNRPATLLAEDTAGYETPGYYGPSASAAPSLSPPTFCDVASLTYAPPPSGRTRPLAALTRLPPANIDCSDLDQDALLRICPSDMTGHFHRLMDQRASINHLRLAVTEWLATSTRDDNHSPPSPL